MFVEERPLVLRRLRRRRRRPRVLRDDLLNLCDYLHRLARVSWKKAQFALASGDFDRANENFFVATNSYLKAITRSVGDKREQFTAELAILRKEIAKSKSSDRDQVKDSADGAEI
mgnify:CR=1 FL=1